MSFSLCYWVWFQYCCAIYIPLPELHFADVLDRSFAFFPFFYQIVHAAYEVCLLQPFWVCSDFYCQGCLHSIHLFLCMSASVSKAWGHCLPQLFARLKASCPKVMSRLGHTQTLSKLWGVKSLLPQLLSQTHIASMCYPHWVIFCMTNCQQCTTALSLASMSSIGERPRFHKQKEIHRHCLSSCSRRINDSINLLWRFLLLLLVGALCLHFILLFVFQSFGAFSEQSQQCISDIS